MTTPSMEQVLAAMAKADGTSLNSFVMDYHPERHRLGFGPEEFRYDQAPSKFEEAKHIVRLAKILQELGLQAADPAPHAAKPIVNSAVTITINAGSTTSETIAALGNQAARCKTTIVVDTASSEPLRGGEST